MLCFVSGKHQSVKAMGQRLLDSASMVQAVACQIVSVVLD
jgi:hypothetical protein